MSEVLQTLRLKGRATAQEIGTSMGVDPAEVEKELQSLAESHLVIERTTGKRPGWLLTGDGRDRHEASLAEQRTPAVVERLTKTYESFLKFNVAVKDLSARWQAITDDAERFDIIEELLEIEESVAPSLISAGEVAPRFGEYHTRLAASLEKAREDPRYVVSPTVDSFHTVWFECHEDYLLMLNKSRAEEGSW